LAILLYTKSFVVYCLQAPLISRHQQSCLLTSVALISQICEQIILFYVVLVVPNTILPLSHL